MERRIIKEYDVLRVIVTLLVIVGHSTYFSIMTNYGGCDYSGFTEPNLSIFYKLANLAVGTIYLFHMPLYMALSGALMRYRVETVGEYNSLKHLVFNKIPKLIIPFIVVTVVFQIPIKYLGGYYDESENIFKDMFVGQFLIQGNTHLWFLPTLFVIFILVYLLEKFVKIKLKYKLLLFAVISIFHSFIPIALLNHIIQYLFWFYAGYCFEIERENLNNRIKHRKTISLLLTCILFIISIAILKLLIPEDNSVLIKLLTNIMELLCGALGCCIVYILSYLLTYTKILDNLLFKLIRQNTLGLYLYSDMWNYVILAIGVELFGSWIFISNIGSALFIFARIILTFVISLLISIILKKMKIKYIS